MPAADVPLQVRCEPEGVLEVGPLTPTTDSSGRASVAFRAGDLPAKVGFTVRAGDAVECGMVYVTEVPVELPIGDPKFHDFSVEEEILLQMLFWDKDRVSILRQFGGGLSGSRVLQVQATDRDGAELTQVVKIGVRDSILSERDNYELLRKHVVRATPIVADAAYGIKGAIVYGDATAAGALAPVVPLAEYFATHSSEELRMAMFAILEGKDGKGLRSTYRYYACKHENYRRLIGKFLPEDLVVTLDGGLDALGVYPSGNAPPASPEVLELKARDLERKRLDVPAGTVVLLRDFLVSKMQDDDLNLEDKGKSRHKVKVRYDGMVPQGISTGDRVDVLARVITDRDSRLKFAVEHCLQQHGAQACKSGWACDDQAYPDPLVLLNAVLNRSCDVAWGTIHGDLHWENVVLERPENWWLIDYGLTCKGPILFDFVKLELYLRVRVLPEITELSARELLEWEQTLVDNPLGELREDGSDHPQLRKAAVVIRAIRRMARRYVLNDFFDYWRLLFASGMALTKYYPTRDKWERAKPSPEEARKLAASSRETFHVLAMALAIGRLLHWDQVGNKTPKLRCRFVPMGSRLKPQPKAVALDVGSSCELGVLDHHLGEGAGECAASLAFHRPQLFLDHLGHAAPRDVTWIVHQHPDFDCVASVLLAWYRHTHGFFPPGARNLAEYTRQVDAGAGFLDTEAFPERTPYALFQTRCQELQRLDLPHEQLDELLLQYGWEVLAYCCTLEAQGVHPLVTNRVPAEHPFWGAVGRDREVYKNQDLSRGKRIKTSVLESGRPTEVDGLVIDAPTSVLYKAWSRRAGYRVLVVRWPQADKPDHRIVVSVPPAMKQALKGLGRALEAAEKQRREVLGKQRPPPPRWPDVDNADPWYDGRAALHAYTIVDAPREGTVLDLHEVVDILQQDDWLRSGDAADSTS
jgi:hypothetical protein